MLFGGRECSVVPVFITQHVGDVLASARIARHRGVEPQLVGHKKAVAAGDGFLVDIESGRVHFSEQKCAVGQRLAVLGGLQCGSAVAGACSRRVHLVSLHGSVINLYYSFLISLINFAGECNDDTSGDCTYT